ncbi:MAG: cytochrome c oxidase subunit 3 [Hyphomicrobiaceae bacterium]
MADAHAKHHDYHLVNPSPWPLVGSIGAFTLAFGAIQFFISHKAGEPQYWYLAPGFAIVLLTMYLWWRDVVKEAHGGDHTPVVQLHLRYGMLLFIASEVMFFVAWFWAYFDAALYPGQTWTLPNSQEVIGLIERRDLTGGHWPPIASENFQHTFDPWKLPLINTLILLTSGTTVTWAHHALLEGNRRGLVWGLVLTILLGLSFTALQAIEYGEAAFSYSGHIYGATFFMATGFHGAHVIIGTLFLIVCLFRALAGHFTPKQHFGFEAAAWYWHFVDVVWLFLFACIYVWGKGGPLFSGGVTH